MSLEITKGTGIFYQKGNRKNMSFWPDQAEGVELKRVFDGVFDPPPQSDGQQTLAVPPCPAPGRSAARP